MIFCRLCDSYDALPTSTSKQTTPTTALYNTNFASLTNGNHEPTIYRCSSDCCSAERLQRLTKAHLQHHKHKHSHTQGNNKRKHKRPQPNQKSLQNLPLPCTPTEDTQPNYEYIIEDNLEDESTIKTIISENEEDGIEHEDHDALINSFSYDDTTTCDDITIEEKNLANRPEGESASGGETCCSCSDESCLYEEPLTSQTQVLRIEDNN